MASKREIPTEEALERYQVVTDDAEMENGEVRFRRKKLSDGTAYIRTEASAQGGWQQSHYHKHVRETYIVQKGWIGYAELVNDDISLAIYRAGQLCTTRPGIIHNVYMPGGAVIHTVKHGDPPHDDLDDRKTDPETERFTALTSDMSEKDIQRWAIARTATEGEADKKETYSAQYRHFDQLIWQLPTWSTALFALTVVGANSIANATYLTSATQLTSGDLASGLFGLTFLVILVLSHAMHRFRKHQASLQLYPRTPLWRSASTWFQFTVTAEAFILLFLAILLKGVPARKASWICLTFLVGITIYRECSLRQRQGSSRSAI